MYHYKVKAIAATTKRSSKNTTHPPIRTCGKKNRAPFHQILGSFSTKKEEARLFYHLPMLKITAIFLKNEIAFSQKIE